MNTTLTEHNISTAILRGDEIYHYQEGSEQFDINLPKGQTAGTETQKISYARSKAKEIVSNLNSK